MKDKVDNVFDYNLNYLEREVLGLQDYDEITYLRLTDHQKILSDLHLLFLMRKDKDNYERVTEKILLTDDWA